ncbi:hypothetical protein [Salinicoccus roseus]|uniref:hypothetical protein n=1 Tax=Salinicoccus roseus TaxID=45670 RepID=UPI003DA14982
MKKLKLLFLPFAVVLLILSACGNDEPEATNDSAVDTESESVVEEPNEDEESSDTDGLFNEDLPEETGVDGCVEDDYGVSCSVVLPEEYEAFNKDLRDADDKSAEVAEVLFEEFTSIPSTDVGELYAEEISSDTFSTYINVLHTSGPAFERALDNYRIFTQNVIESYDKNFTDKATIPEVNYIFKSPDESGDGGELGRYRDNEAHTWFVFQFNLEECMENNCAVSEVPDALEYTDFIDTSDFMYEELNIEEYDINESLFKGSF